MVVGEEGFKGLYMKGKDNRCDESRREGGMEEGKGIRVNVVWW